MSWAWLNMSHYTLIMFYFQSKIRTQPAILYRTENVWCQKFVVISNNVWRAIIRRERRAVDRHYLRWMCQPGLYFFSLLSTLSFSFLLHPYSFLSTSPIYLSLSLFPLYFYIYLSLSHTYSSMSVWVSLSLSVVSNCAGVRSLNSILLKEDSDCTRMEEVGLPIMYFWPRQSHVSYQR